MGCKGLPKSRDSQDKGALAPERGLPLSQRTLETLNRGDRIEGIYLLEDASLKTARNGKFFVPMTLRDRTATVKAMRWESSQEEFREIQKRPFIRIEGRVEEYQGAPQVIVDRLDPMSAEDAGLEATEFLPRTKHEIPELERELEERVAALQNDDVRQLVVTILARPGLRDRLRLSPAGKAMHHAYIGGLLEHVISLVQLADKVCDHYPWLDRDILIAGVLLHDIAKTEELGIENGFTYTAEGQLLGHIVMCCNWIHEAAKDIGNLDEEVVLQIQHLVASHHGKLEFGSPKRPSTPEALAMHFIDNLDAKLTGFLELFGKAAPGPGDPRFGDHSHLLETRPYFAQRLDGYNGMVTREMTPDSGSESRENRPSSSSDSGSSEKADKTGDLPF